MSQNALNIGSITIVYLQMTKLLNTDHPHNIKSWLRNVRPICPPMLELFNKKLNSSIYTLKRIGDIIPPYFTPLEI